MLGIIVVLTKFLYQRLQKFRLNCGKLVINMKKFLLVPVVLMMTACSSTPTYKLSGYKGPEAMDRNEAVQASKQCVFAKMRPNVEYLSVRTTEGPKVMVPVNVHCEPY